MLGTIDGRVPGQIRFIFVRGSHIFKSHTGLLLPLNPTSIESINFLRLPNLLKVKYFLLNRVLYSGPPWVRICSFQPPPIFHVRHAKPSARTLIRQGLAYLYRRHACGGSHLSPGSHRSAAACATDLATKATGAAENAPTPRPSKA
jgi:hypothetical protein